MTTYQSLYLTKYTNTEANNTEILIATADSNYSKFSVSVSPGRLDDATNGIWVVDREIVYFIKLKNADSNTVEVHRLSSDHTKWDVQSKSGISISDADNGTFTIDNGDLWFIKTKNVGSGFVEVHVAGASSGYNDLSHTVTTLRPTTADSGSFTVRSGRLYYIKTRNVESDNVELFVMDSATNYRPVAQWVTWFSPEDDKNGVWTVGPNADLYFIKTKNVGSRHIEVHIATAVNQYNKVLHMPTVFGAGRAADGYWAV